MRNFVLAVVLLAGCSSHTAWHASVGKPHVNPQVQIDSAAGLVALFGLSVLAGGAYDATRGAPLYSLEDPRRVPEMAPDRRISEQDCTKPLDYTLGNIRCK